MLIDTTFLIDLQRELAGGRMRGACRLLSSHPDAVPWISLFTWMEFAEGYPAEKEDACRLFLSRFSLILPDSAIAFRASRISRALRQSGSTIGDHDLWIAATAIERDLPLVARNPRRFRRIPDLKILGY
jgi:predicted nucleic acid-binding protein